MNEFERISEFNNHVLSAKILHPRKQDWNLFVFEINGNQTFTSQIHRVIGPMRGKLDFFIPLVFEAETEFDHKTSKLKP